MNKIRTQRSVLERAWDRFGVACDRIGDLTLKGIRHEFFPLFLIGLLFLIVSRMDFVETAVTK